MESNLGNVPGIKCKRCVEFLQIKYQEGNLQTDSSDGVLKYYRHGEICQVGLMYAIKRSLLFPWGFIQSLEKQSNTVSVTKGLENVTWISLTRIVQYYVVKRLNNKGHIENIFILMYLPSAV